MNVAVIGLGNMGGAIVTGLLRSGVSPSDIRGFDVEATRATALGCTPAGTLDDCAGAEQIVVAVKPPLVVATLRSLPPARVVISVAAGVGLDALEAAAPQGTNVIRAMPNTAARVCASTTALVARSADVHARARAQALFDAVGSTLWLASEAMMPVATAVVGSAPAFVYVLAEALTDGAVLEGMPRVAARAAVASMLGGAAALLAEHPGSPADLKDGVASPGGTTIAGLRALEQAGFRAAAIDAVAASARRAREIV